ncbi:hypothetical protein [Propioniciclava flava]|uniref:Uncharacterized protein n=1 Tax=Propioniciclava flava TaxID=2072026 RepID=A0A4Q2EGW1_9ACTN|nr:hypothetical protein [Propioniciclava flava]RXW32621.1 hypothetical protein C1706_05550 [Propioniciclava flava]
MSLIIAELSRILHRRATWMLVVVGLALTAIPSLFLVGTDAEGGIPADGLMLSCGLIGSFLCLCLGATYWGADFRHGTISSLLLFVPSRTRLWVARTLALALASMGMMLIVAGHPVLRILLRHATVMAASGTAGVLPMLVRVLVLGVVSGLAGGFLGIVFKNTAGAVLVPLGALMVRWLLTDVVVEHAVWMVRFLPDTYVSALLQGETTVPWRVDASGELMNITVTYPEALGGTTLLLTLLGVLSWALFRYRSVTE